MKKHFLTILLFFVLLLSSANLCFGAESKISASDQVALGDSFDVVLSIDASITSASIKIEFSQSLQFLSYSKVEGFGPIVTYDDELHQGVIMNPSGGAVNGNYLVLKFKANSLDKNAYIKVVNSLNNGSSSVNCTKSIWVLCKQHNFPDWTVVNASCTNDGYKSRKCSTCGYEEKTIIKATGHEVSEYSVIKEPTCTSTGLSSGICKKCNETISKVEPLAEHNFSSEYKVVQEGSLSKASILEYSCIDCGFVKNVQGLCSETSVDTNITLSCKEGVFTENSVLVVEKIDESSSEVDISNIKNISKVYDIFDISVLADNEKVQPNGEVEVCIPLSEKYSSNVCLAYIDDNGNIEIMNSWITDGCIHANLTHFSTYSIIDLSSKDNNIHLYLEVFEAIVIIVLAILLFKKSKKNEK